MKKRQNVGTKSAFTPYIIDKIISYFFYLAKFPNIYHKIKFSLVANMCQEKGAVAIQGQQGQPRAMTKEQKVYCHYPLGSAHQ